MELFPRVAMAVNDLCRCIRRFLQTTHIVELIHK